MKRQHYVCGLDAAVDIINGKWKVLILWELSLQHRRFGELKRQVVGVSEKVLSQHLREMEEDGLVHRETYDEVPPRVVYSLTALGISLTEALTPLSRWAEENVMGIQHTTNGVA
ncbi:winged helix-turn-helix transcriptional regulator [Actinokineospora iranica]|uniref:DNA-binding transcriptional regulator, HxlR family n=1 Tax=Actinokineospora iranica TaxID=1271860 RepID=A0A1G6RY81_9PSEU|nr:helix-turn-helix domain-containing protein [Actinokineospora iranica]SDD09381.1 DNA-binding transcriptional regulator, HxlR family [Actinokineospora iranica]